MLDIKEIEYWISKLESEDSSFPAYSKLADLYAIRNQMLGISAQEPQVMAYSETATPIQETLGEYGDSEFLQAVAGKDSAAAWAVMDELMDTLRVVNQRAYESVMRKLKKPCATKLTVYLGK